ncbi:MAG: hypothetical protein WEA56_15535 [Balneolaceae bacterium]
MKKIYSVIPLLIFSACSETESFTTENTKDAFFEALTTLCGESYEGDSVYPDDPDHEMYGAELFMNVAECEENEIRIPFRVNEDESRTWIITYYGDDLLLKHDHRYPDGTPHSLTNYGGIAHDDGTASAQYFVANAETAEMLPEASTNVWMMKINEEEGVFVYYLERHNEPRYRAEFRME